MCDLTESYKILKIDERASNREVELAYNVLSKNAKDIETLSKIKTAFENIMSNRDYKSLTVQDILDSVKIEYTDLVDPDKLKRLENLENLSEEVGLDIPEDLKDEIADLNINAINLIANIRRYIKKIKVINFEYISIKDLHTAIQSEAYTQYHTYSGILTSNSNDIVIKIHQVVEMLENSQDKVITPYFKKCNTKLGSSFVITCTSGVYDFIRNVVLNLADSYGIGVDLQQIG